jgi:hypothetical protein
VARIALPFAVVPGLVAALQEQLRTMQESSNNPQEAGPGPWTKGPLH